MSASQQAYLDIRQKILCRDYAAGHHLREQQLVEELGMSRTPIRSALKRLADEGFVEVRPRCGTYVASLSPDDFEDVFSLGALLESYAAEQAATRIDEAGLAGLLRCCAAMDAKIEAPGELDLDGYLAANDEFHHRVRAAAGSARLNRMLDQLVDQRLLVITAVRYNREDLYRTHDHHKQMFEALRDRDGRCAAAMMRAHVGAAYRAARRAFDREHDKHS